MYLFINVLMYYALCIIVACLLCIILCINILILLRPFKTCNSYFFKNSIKKCNNVNYDLDTEENHAPLQSSQKKKRGKKSDANTLWVLAISRAHCTKESEPWY